MLKSAGFLAMSQVVTLASGLVVLGLVARYLGPALFGEQAVFRSIAHIALPLMTGGLRVNVAKEIGRDPEGAPSYVGSVPTLRWAMSIVITLVALALIYALPLTHEREIAGMATILLLLASVWQVVANAIFIAYESSQYVLGMSLVSGLLTIPATMAAIRLDTGVPGVLAAAAVAPFLTAQVGFAIAFRRLVRPKLNADVARWGTILKDSLPVGLGAMFRRSYSRVDVLLLAALRNAEAAGVFSVAYRAAIQITTLSITVGTAAVPRMSRLAERSQERLRAVFEHSLVLLLALSIPGAGLIAAFAAPLIAVVVGPAFSASVAALRLICFTIVISAPDALLFFCLVALGRESAAVKWLAVSVVANVVFDALLIPQLGVQGACLGTIGAEWIYFGLSLMEVHRWLRLRIVWRPLAKLAVAAALAALVIAFAGADRPAMAAVAAMVTYVVACAVTKAIPSGTVSGLRRAATTAPPATVQAAGTADPDDAAGSSSSYPVEGTASEVPPP